MTGISVDIAAYLDEHYLSGFLFPAHTKGWQTIVNGYIENEVESVTFKVNDAVLSSNESSMQVVSYRWRL